MANGTFGATGSSEPIAINDKADLSLVFEGSGSVTVQRYINGGWRSLPDATWTADHEDIIYSGSLGRQYRLDCTARGADIHWEIS